MFTKESLKIIYEKICEIEPTIKQLGCGSKNIQIPQPVYFRSEPLVVILWYHSQRRKDFIHPVFLDYIACGNKWEKLGSISVDTDIQCDNCNEDMLGTYYGFTDSVLSDLEGLCEECYSKSKNVISYAIEHDDDDKETTIYQYDDKMVFYADHGQEEIFYYNLTVVEPYFNIRSFEIEKNAIGLACDYCKFSFKCYAVLWTDIEESPKIDELNHYLCKKCFIYYMKKIYIHCSPILSYFSLVLSIYLPDDLRVHMLKNISLMLCLNVNKKLRLDMV